MAGVREEVHGFKAFYAQLRRRFRYGQVGGSEWQAANGAAQGCPASPDLLSLLLEAFHRWARAAGYGVAIGMTTVSYADGVASMAGSKAEMRVLISAYLRCCMLLNLEVTKVQLWWNGRGPQQLHVDSLTVETSPVLRKVGVMLAAHEATATAV